MVQQRLGVLPKTVTLSLGQVRCGILAHFERTGKWPGVSSGQIGELGIQAKTLNTRLAEGKAGLPGGSSLAQEVAHVKAALGIETVPVQDLTVVAVHHAITVYHRAHGEWPRAGSGLSELGITFHTLNKYLKQGGRGLQGGSSLAKEVKQVSTHMAEGMPAP